MEKIYVITYRYMDGSGPGSVGVVGAYTDEDRALETMKLLDAHGDMSKVFEITEVETEIKK